MELGIKEGILEVDVAMEVGAHYSLKFAELTGFGLIGAANACLREGLARHPESPLLQMLKTRLLEGGTRGAALWRFEEACLAAFSAASLSRASSISLTIR